MDEAEFRIIELEYKQASDLMQRGIEVFSRIMKFFILLNMATMLLAYAVLKFTMNQNNFLFLLYIALCGILICLLTYLFHRRTMVYIRQWLARASEIEAHFGGRVFTRTLEIEKQDRNSIVPTYPALLILYPLFGFGWMLLIYIALAR